jgi:hypothetical protein
MRIPPVELLGGFVLFPLSPAPPQRLCHSEVNFQSSPFYGGRESGGRGIWAKGFLSSITDVRRKEKEKKRVIALGDGVPLRWNDVESFERTGSIRYESLNARD